MFRKSFILIFLLMFVGAGLFAQNGDAPKMKLKSMSPVSGGLEKMIIPQTEVNAGIPSDYKGYSDADLDQLEKEMKERDWNREDTAWIRACELDTQAAYARYIALYPSGAHFPQATAKLIEAKIDETLENAHEELPEIECVKADENSPTSTLIIRNHTGLSLTVYCSGSQSKSVVIAPGGRDFITVENGAYKLAATVPPVHIRPYAGTTFFAGGQYEIGFWVVTR